MKPQMNSWHTWLPVVAFAVAAAVATPRLLPPAAPRFHLPPPDLTRKPPIAPSFETHLLTNPQPSAHAATLAELPDGRLVAAWFGGSREGARDVALYQAEFDGRQWGEARPIITRQAAEQAAGRVVRKIGNPVLATDTQRPGLLHLWFVTVGYGGWAGSAINHTVSHDDGKTWHVPRRLITSPFWNLSTLVRNAPLPLSRGGWGLPAYHEFAAKRSEWLRLDADSKVLDKVRLPGSQRSLQPAIAALDDGNAMAMMRDAGSDNRIRRSSTTDAGLHWQSATTTGLPNPNASVALLRLADGRLLLAYNPQTANRNQLALALSSDRGTTWSPPRWVENATGGEEFSYPTLLQAKDGRIHLAYTWQRRTIKHLSFPPDWLSPP